MTNISVEIIKDSITEGGKRITTFCLEYPRFIHSEFMTHRVFSRNAASSRAIPVKKVIDQVWNNPAMPVEWGMNVPGMQAKEQLSGWRLKLAIGCWKTAAKAAAIFAKIASKVGLHKQVANRLLEPFQRIKVIATATEFDNFFSLRCHKDAQPEIQILATKMLDAMNKSTPKQLTHEQWHLPYVDTVECERYGWQSYFLQGTLEEITIEEALEVSASCCAQVSYRALDDSLVKAKNIYNKLIKSSPMHASPFEHQARPMNVPKDDINWDAGTTHEDTNCERWSGNFQGWIQHRQLL